MDSISQFVLGAAMGEAALGKKIGNKAILWGGIAGTIPDLDILFYPFLDELSRLTIHRGFSHALIFAFIAAPIFAWFLFQWYRLKPRNLREKYKDKNVLLRWLVAPIDWFTHRPANIEVPSYRDWVKLFFLALFTHPLLDSFTVYGTQLFLPFSDYRVGVNNIFIVDPLYTVPLIICLVIVSRLIRTNQVRPYINYLGIIISCAYIGLTLFNKMKVNTVFETALNQQAVQYERFMTANTPLNSILWYCVAEGEKGYWLGYYSLWDKDETVKFYYLERQDELISSIKSSKAIDRLIWFSKGYYLVRQEAEGLFLHDLKFGRAGFGDQADYVFSFKIEQDADGTVSFTPRREPPEGSFSELFGLLWTRIKGNKVF